MTIPRPPISDDSSIGLVGVPNPGGRFPTIAGLCNTGLGTNTSPCTGTGGMMSMGLEWEAPNP